MKGLFVAIMFLGTLSSAPIVEQPVIHHHHQHSTQQEHVHQMEVLEVARGTVFKAVCSKGDLNATFQNRADAVKAAQAHQKATGHKTSVR